LACASILQILMRSLLYYAAPVVEFEPDPFLRVVGGRLVLMATRVYSTRGLVPIRSTTTPGCPTALLRVPYQSAPGQAMWALWAGGSSPHPRGTHPGWRDQIGAQDTTEATTTTCRSHNTRGEALATSSSDIYVDLWFML